MEGFPYRKFSFSRRKGVVRETGPGVLPSEDQKNLLAGTQRLVSCLGSGRIQIPEYFSRTQFIKDKNQLTPLSLVSVLLNLLPIL